MTLLQGKKGCSYKIIAIHLEEKVRKRMEMLGMTDGTAILVLNRKKSGSVILKVRGTRFAMGRRFAEGIEVGGENKWQQM